MAYFKTSYSALPIIPQPANELWNNSGFLSIGDGFGTYPSAPNATENGQSLRWNDGAGSWEYFTAGGITNGALADEIPKSDGTNLVTSGITTTTAGTTDFNNAASTSKVRILSAATGARISKLKSTSDDTFTLASSNGNSTLNNGDNTGIVAGNAHTSAGNGNGGSITLTSGTKRGTGLPGAISFYSKGNIIIAPDSGFHATVSSGGFTVGGRNNLGVAIGLSSASFGFANSLPIDYTFAHGSSNTVLTSFSAILGSDSSTIPAATYSTVIIGGSAITARTGDHNQVYVPNFNIVSTPPNDDALVQVLVRDNTNGQIKYRSASSFPAGGTLGAGVDGNIYINPDSGGVIKLINIPTSSAGLPTGSVWSNAGVLSIV